MSELEKSHIYKVILQEASKYHNNAIGVTNYIGLQGSDQTYPKIFNFQTLLLIELYQKIESLEEKLQSLETRTIGIVTQNDLKTLSEKIVTGKEIIPYNKSKCYKIW